MAPPRRWWLSWMAPTGLALAVACASSPEVRAPAAAAPAADGGDDAAPADGAGASPRARAEALLRRMTLEEKIAYVGGDRSFYIRAVPRLGIPEIKMADGPAGCRNWGPSTAYPSAVGLAAAFDGALAERVGGALGRDCRARGVHLLLAPGVNIQRSPLNGRNFEYLGEDPFLSGKTAAAIIRGVQAEGVLATVKHFAANNQEWDRNHVSSEVDERTLREIYFPAFERAVREGHVGAVMSAYNLLNGTYCTHDAWLLKDVLEGDWGFEGFVMSDWSAAHDPAGTANGGCDLEMPSGEQMNERTLLPLIAQGRVATGTLDDKVRRILRAVVAAGFLDRKQQRDDIPRDDPGSVETALAAARESIVLLRNEGALLPLDRTRLKRIAVIGPNAHPAVWGGSGSAFVTPLHAVSLLDAITRGAGGAQVVHHPGVRQPSDAARLGRPFVGPVRQEVFAGKDLSGKPVLVTSVDRIDFAPEEGAAPAPGLGSEHYSIRWTGEVSAPRAGRYQVVTNADDGIRVRVDGRLVIDDWHDHAPTVDTARLELAAGKHAIVVEYYQGTLGAVAQLGFGPETQARQALTGGAEVTALAHHADIVIVAVGFGQSADTGSAGAAYKPFWPPDWARKAGVVEAEDSDRPFALPPAQIETVRLAALANPRTIVVVNAGGAVDLAPFADRVRALVWAWYPGQEGGRALAEVLFGEVSPSGKLPVTFARRYEDYPSAPYYNLVQGGKTPYTEGVFVGYRGFDRSGVEPAFAFGHGLSYTSFAYADPAVAPAAGGAATVSLTVRNSGLWAGDEIVQVYVAPPPGRVPRPPQELKGFARVSLSPGESKRVSITLEPRAFAYWDQAAKGWAVEGGAYEIRVGASSRDIRLRQRLDVTASSLPR